MERAAATSAGAWLDKTLKRGSGFSNELGPDSAPYQRWEKLRPYLRSSTSQASAPSSRACVQACFKGVPWGIGVCLYLRVGSFALGLVMWPHAPSALPRSGGPSAVGAGFHSVAPAALRRVPAVLLPSHGRYVGASSIPFSEYKRKRGDRVGLNWRIPLVRGRRSVRHVVFDTNYWKSFVHARLAVPMGDPGCLSLFGQAGGWRPQAGAGKRCDSRTSSLQPPGRVAQRAYDAGIHDRGPRMMSIIVRNVLLIVGVISARPW